MALYSESSKTLVQSVGDFVDRSFLWHPIISPRCVSDEADGVNGRIHNAANVTRRWETVVIIKLPGNQTCVSMLHPLLFHWQDASRLHKVTLSLWICLIPVVI